MRNNKNLSWMVILSLTLSVLAHAEEKAVEKTAKAPNQWDSHIRVVKKEGSFFANFGGIEQELSDEDRIAAQYQTQCDAWGQCVYTPSIVKDDRSAQEIGKKATAIDLRKYLGGYFSNKTGERPDLRGYSYDNSQEDVKECTSGGFVDAECLAKHTRQSVHATPIFSSCEIAPIEGNENIWRKRANLKVLGEEEESTDEDLVAMEYLRNRDLMKCHTRAAKRDGSADIAEFDAKHELGIGEALKDTAMELKLAAAGEDAVGVGNGFKKIGVGLLALVNPMTYVDITVGAVTTVAGIPATLGEIESKSEGELLNRGSGLLVKGLAAPTVAATTLVTGVAAPFLKIGALFDGRSKAVETQQAANQRIEDDSASSASQSLGRQRVE